MLATIFQISEVFHDIIYENGHIRTNERLIYQKTADIVIIELTDYSNVMGDDDAPDESMTRQPSSRRRTVLRALGAGAAVPLLGGAASGDGVRTAHEAVEADAGRSMQEEQDGDDCEPCIRAIDGFPLLSQDEESPFEADHTVEAHVDDADVLFPDECDGVEDFASEEDPTTEGGPMGPGAFPDFYFDPVGLHVEPGDVVEFPNVSPDLHTVTAIAPRFFGFPQRVPEDATQFSSGIIMPGENWLYRFDVPGVYDLMCFPHVDLGMVLRIVVHGDGDVPSVEPLPTEGESAAPPTVTTVLNADRLSPQNIVDNGSVAWADLEGEVQTFDPDELFGEH